MGYERTAKLTDQRRSARRRELSAHFAICQRVDDHAESTQTLVDLLGLLERLARCSSLADLLGSGQIDEVESSGLLSARLGMASLHGNNEDGMRARRLGVHVCRCCVSEVDEKINSARLTRRSNSPSVSSLPHDLVHLGRARDVKVSQVLDVDSSRLVLVYGQIVVFGCIKESRVQLSALDNGSD